MSAASLFATFTNYGDTSGRWSGADSTVSMPLPDGRDAWLFSDTLIGPINADLSRPTSAAFIHNSMVVQDGSQLVQTVTGGTSTVPDSLVKPTDPNDFYWVGDGTVEAGSLHVLYGEYRKTGNGGLDVQFVRTVLASFALPSLNPTAVTALPLGSTIAWGSALLEDGAYSYIYGTSAATGGGLPFAHVARVPAGGLTGAWQFWTGSGWSTDESQAAAVLSGVGTGFAVQRMGGQYVLVTQQANLAFSPDFVAYTATSPTGPWTGPVPLFTAPEPVPGNSIIVYDSRVHQELATAGKLLVSYNVNSLNSGDLYSDAHIYRPRFVDVTWPRPVPDPATLPAAPSALSATPGENGIVHLSWTAPPGSGLNYRIYQRDVTAGQSFAARLSASTTGTSFDVGLLRTGHTYEFSVAAVNAAGQGPTSATVSIAVQVVPTAAPTNVTANATDNGQVVVSWSAVAGAWNYDLFQRDVTAGETTFTKMGTAGGLDTSLTAGGLQSGDVYEFYVVANNGGGPSAPSATVRATARYAVPPAPAGLTATANTDGTITLAWTASSVGVWYLVYQRDVTAGETDFTQLPLPITSGTTMTAGFLTNGHTYQFKVTATNQGGESAPSNLAQAVSTYPPPPAVSNLRAVAGDGQVVLTWDSAGSDFWYWVYQRDVTAGDPDFTRLPLPIAGGTTMTAGYLTNGHTYQFKVTAVSQAGEGAPSNVVQAIPSTPPPAAPTGLTARANSDGTITLSWTAPESGLLYWVYQQDVTAGGAWQQLPLPIDGVTMTAGLLTNNHTYAFKVSAVKAGVEGPATSPVQAVAHYAPPPAPTNLRGVSAGDGTVELTWDAPAPNLYYWVYQRDVTAGETTFQKLTYPTTATSADPGLLRNGDTYEFKVSAQNAGGEGPACAPIQVVSHGGVPAAPTNLTATAGDGQAVLRWTASTTSGVLYNVYQRDTTIGQSWQKLPLPTSNTSMTAGYLTDGHTYEFKVTASNASGDSAASNIASARPMPPVPAAPTGVTATAGDGTVTLRWTASTTPNVYYWIEYRSHGGSWQRLAYPVPGQTSFTVSYLWNGTTYDFRVRATNISGDSAASNVATATPLPPFPQAPSGLSASAGDGLVSLHWSASPTAGVWYWIEYRAHGGSWQRLAYPVPGQTSLTVHYLVNGTTYDFRVRATNAAGDSSPSNVASARPLPPLPRAPPSLSATPVISGVRLNWQPSPTSPVYYWVYYRLAGRTTWTKLPLPVDGTSLTVVPLDDLPTYEFGVRATNLAGNSPLSPIATARPKPSKLTQLMIFTQPTAGSYNAWLGARQNQSAWADYNFDWHTDFCTDSPDEPFGFDFRLPCARHDFGFNNFRPMGICDAVKHELDFMLWTDLYRLCDTYGGLSGVACRRVADVYYSVLSIFPGC
jgi:fibronectin type 3 domain-containing protein